MLTDYKTGITLADADDGSKDGIQIGTGPFRMASYSPDRVVLERNTNYWKGSAAYLDEVEFRAGLSASDIASGLRSGLIDLARDLSLKILKSFSATHGFVAGWSESPRKNTYF